jgi:hypothetical protein
MVNLKYFTDVPLFVDVPVSVSELMLHPLSCKVPEPAVGAPEAPAGIAIVAVATLLAKRVFKFASVYALAVVGMV